MYCERGAYFSSFPSFWLSILGAKNNFNKKKIRWQQLFFSCSAIQSFQVSKLSSWLTPLRQTEKEKTCSSSLINGPNPFLQSVMILFRGWLVKMFSRGSHLGPRGWSPNPRVWAPARHLKQLVMLPQPWTSSPRAPLTLDQESLSQWFTRKPKVWQLEKCKPSALRDCILTLLPEANHSTGVALSTQTSFYWAQTQWNSCFFGIRFFKIKEISLNLSNNRKGERLLSTEGKGNIT